MKNNIISIPNLDMNTLRHIVCDAAEQYPYISAVGVAGSFARGETKHSSDVDLVIDVDKSMLSDALGEFGEYVRNVLDYQFNKKLDIVRYGLVKERANQTPVPFYSYYQDGYKEILKDVRWIYERSDTSP